MRFPDAVTRHRSAASDEYGNPASSWETGVATTTIKAFVTGDKALMPPGTDVADGDRLVYGTKTFDVVELDEIRSPARLVMLAATLRRVDG